MSWLARSIANTLNLEDNEPEESKFPSQSESQLSLRSGGGVKEDLSEITKTLTRQFWGVASFLAPPPQTSNESQPSDTEPSGIDGIKSDFAEIGGKFKTGISKLSGNINVSEISKIASNFLQLGSDEGRDWNDSAIGITEDVLAFVRNVSLHPETWLDFPLPEKDENDFDMSDEQQEHALAVERLVPELAALRFELCPGYVSEGCFWRIYFVLVHPRLDKQDAELLTTPEVLVSSPRCCLSIYLGIAEWRAKLTGDSQKQSQGKSSITQSETDTYYSQNNASSHEESLSVPSGSPSDNRAFKTPIPEPVATRPQTGSRIEKNTDLITEIPIVDKPVVDEKVPVGTTEHQNPLSVPFKRVFEDNDDDDGDDWLKEETSEPTGTSGTDIPIISNDEDVSFSDLEDDDDTDVPECYKNVDGSDKEWVHLSRSSSDSVKDNR